MVDPNKAYKDIKNSTVEVSRICHHCASNFIASVSINELKRNLFYKCTVCDWTNFYWHTDA